MNWFGYTVGNVQTALIVLKLVGVLSASWWVVFVPLLVMVVLSLIVAAAGGDGAGEDE